MTFLHLALQCPDRSRPTDCVDSSSNSCPALLQPVSSAIGCAEGCQCSYGNVFDAGECVPYSQCGCTLHDLYIKVSTSLMEPVNERSVHSHGNLQLKLTFNMSTHLHFVWSPF